MANILWLLFGGIFIAIEYLLSSVVLMLTIIGIPFGLQALKMAELALNPFGLRAIEKHESRSVFYVIMNIIWLILGGFWICLTHLGLALLLAITIIGLPFAKQHLKLAELALAPFGKEIVSSRDIKSPNEKK